MNRIALLLSVLMLVACGEARGPETSKHTPQTVEKTLVFADGTTAEFEARQGEADSWNGYIKAGPVVLELSGTREGDRFVFPGLQCSQHAAVKVNLVGDATFSFGLFSVDATVTDSAPEKHHPATGRWAYYADGITYPGVVTSYSIDAEIPIAILGNLMIMPFDFYAWRPRPKPSYEKAITIKPIPEPCMFLGELLRSNEFQLFAHDLAKQPLIGNFNNDFTTMTFDFTSAITQTSRNQNEHSSR